MFVGMGFKVGWWSQDCVAVVTKAGGRLVHFLFALFGMGDVSVGIKVRTSVNILE